MHVKIRLTMAVILGFVAGFAVSLLNNRNPVQSIGSGLLFALILSTIVAILSWAAETASQKGYSAWLGVFIVVILPIVGILILIGLPALTTKQDKA